MTAPAGIAPMAIKMAAATKAREAGRLTTALLLAPAGFWFLLLLLLPMAVGIGYSFRRRAATGGFQAGFTPGNYPGLSARPMAFNKNPTPAPLGTPVCRLIS